MSDPMRNYGIQSLKNTYSGGITMVGNGPSLDFDNIEMPSLGVNSISLAFPNTDWRPDLYVCCSRQLLANNTLMERVRVVLKLGIPCFLNCDYRPVLGDWDNAHYVSFCRAKHAPMDGDWLQNGIWFYDYATVMTSAAQIAQYLGFTELKFIGIDGYKSYFGDEDPNHFDKDYNTGLLLEGWGTCVFAVEEVNHQQRLAFEHIARHIKVVK